MATIAEEVAPHAGPSRTPLDLPRVMHVNLTSACNLQCRICRPEGAALPVAHLHRDLIARLAADAFESLDELRLDSSGELLLSKNLEFVLAEATSRGVATTISTNGTMLTRQRAELICQSSVRAVQVSLDSPVKETLEWIRARARFEDVLAGAGELVACRRRLGQGRPHIAFHAAVLRQNLHELPDLVRLAATLGVDEVSFAYGYIHEHMDPAWAVFWEQATYTSVMQEVRWVAEDLGIGYNGPPDFGTTSPPTRRCDYLFEKTYVDPSGAVWPCCVSPYELGNLHDSSLREIWHGPRYGELRATYDTDHPAWYKCAACYIMAGWDPGQYRAHFHPAHWPFVERCLAERVVPALSSAPGVGRPAARASHPASSARLALRGKRLVIFGAGAAGRDALEVLDRAGVLGQVVAVCDNDPGKTGSTLAGHRVTRFESLSRDEYDVVIIASQPGQVPISRQLEQAGLVARRDFASMAFVAARALPFLHVPGDDGGGPARPGGQ
jgi:radical SAM protein with 4Fe4S-binding SPASM domain